MANPFEYFIGVAREVSFVRGARLVQQGEAARGAYLIHEGEAQAQVSMPSGDLLKVASFGAGALFGEMALIERGVCSATVVATTDVQGWFIARDDFRAMVASRDARALDAQHVITRTLADRLRALNARVREHPAQEDRRARESAPAGDPLANAQRSIDASFDWKSFLPALPFFDGFDADETQQLIASTPVLELPRGTWLFARGHAASACFMVLRGAVEVFTQADGRERRMAIAGPGELVGYLAALEGAPHGACARVRESAALLELASETLLEIYNGNSSVSVRLQYAIQRSLLKALTRTNTLLTRLISHDRLARENDKAQAMETALHAQIWHAENN